RGDPVLDPQRLADDPSEEHAAEHVERARVAPGEPEIDADHERREAETGQDALLQARREAGAEQPADERPGEDGRDVDEGAGHGARRRMSRAARMPRASRAPMSSSSRSARRPGFAPRTPNCAVLSNGPGRAWRSPRRRRSP